MFSDTVFQAGNFQAQRLSGIRNSKELYNFIKRHFIFSCLLSERVFFPAANYFQSKITQKLTSEFAPLFKHSDRYQQLVYVAINPSKEDFRGEALEKKETYIDTPNYEGYMDSISRGILINRLNSITTPYPRPGKMVDSLSGYIRNETKDDGELFQLINKHIDSETQVRKIFDPLITAVEKQEKAIITEYILMQDHNKNIDKYSERLIGLSLLKAYSSSTQQLYEAYSNNPLIQTYDADFLFPYSIDFLDTCLFEEFLRLFPQTYTEINKIRANEINSLKYSERFIIFKFYYKEFIKNLSLRPLELKEIPSILWEEKGKQLENYKTTLSQVVKNSALAIMLYKSIVGAIARIKRSFGYKIENSKDLFDSYDSFFSFALVNEVSEKFKNQYEVHLMSELRKIHDKGRRDIMISINNKGVLVNKSDISDSTITVNSEKTREVNILLSVEEQNNMKKMAEAIIAECEGLEKSKRMEMAALIYGIIEESEKNDGKIDATTVSPLKRFFSILSKVVQETIIKIATNFITPIAMKFLGLQ